MWAWMRQLSIVAVVAMVFGAGAGYLGGNFDKDWVGLGEERIRGLPASEYQRQRSERDREYRKAQELERELEAIRDTISCVESKAERKGSDFYVGPLGCR
jgi:hypothetical protein